MFGKRLVLLWLIDSERFRRYVLQSRREDFESNQCPINFHFIFDNLPFPSTKSNLEAHRVIEDVINLQKRLWSNIRQIENPWNLKFAMLLRGMLASKRVIQEFKLDDKNWSYLLAEIEKR